MTTAAVFQALGDPTRQAVVERLAQGPATVSQLAAEHPMSLPGFLKHLRVLDEAGVVSRTKVGRVVTCTLQPEPLRQAADWLHDRTAFWNASLDRLTTLLDRPEPPKE